MSSKDILSHASDLVLWLDLEDLIQCFFVCKSWRTFMLNYAFHWTQMLVGRWEIFTCKLNSWPLKTKISRETFFRLVGGLNKARRTPIVYDRSLKAVESTIAFGWGLHRSNTELQERLVVQAFNDHGYEEISRNVKCITFQVANQGVWMVKNVRHRIMLEDIWSMNGEDPFIQPDYLVYFNKISNSVISSLHVTWKWSGYDNGRAHKPIHRVIKDFEERGFVVKKDTPREIIFQRQKYMKLPMEESLCKLPL